MSNSFGNNVVSIPLSGKVIPISSNIALTAASYGNSHLIGGTGNYNISLPLLSSGRAANTITILNDSGSGNSTISSQGPDYIRVNGANVTTLTLLAGDSVTFEHNGTSWSLLDTNVLKANLASPTFSGVPTVPTAAVNTNTTQAASTAFVIGQGSNTNPNSVGIAQPGSSSTFSRSDHIHPNTSATVSFLDSSTTIATTAFVKGSGFSFSNTGGVPISSSMTLPASAMGGWGEIQAAAITVTLPPLSSVPLGATFTFKTNFSTAIKGSGSDNISGSSYGNTLAIAAYQTVTVVANGTAGAWYVINSSYLSAAFSSGSGPAGIFQVLPSGIIIQFGTAGAGQLGTYYENTFPIAFPTSYIGLVATHVGADFNVNIVADICPTPKTTFRLKSNYSAGSVSAHWVAIGY